VVCNPRALHRSIALGKHTYITHYIIIMPVTKEALESAKKMIDDIILEKNCGPIMVRLAWYVMYADFAYRLPWKGS